MERYSYVGPVCEFGKLWLFQKAKLETTLYFSGRRKTIELLIAKLLFLER